MIGELILPSKVFAAEPEDLGMIPWTHVVKGEHWFLQADL